MNKLIVTVLAAILLLSLILVGCTNNGPGNSGTVSPLPGTSNVPRVSPSMTVSPPMVSPSLPPVLPSSQSPGPSVSVGTSPKVSVSVVPSKS